jgi:hypothetical protein
MKLTLARGINVPFSYVIFKDTFNSWDGSYSVTPSGTGTPLEIAGGHAVLVTDFVNKGGRPAALSAVALNTEVAKMSDALDYVVIKNSWGTTVQSPLLRLPGYHTIYQSYIQELAKGNTNISIVVPRDIAFEVRYH